MISLSILLQASPPIHVGLWQVDRDIVFFVLGVGATVIGSLIAHYLRLREDAVKRDRDRQEIERRLWNKSLLNLEHGPGLSKILEAQGLSLEEVARAMPPDAQKEMRTKWDEKAVNEMVEASNKKDQLIVNELIEANKLLG